MKIVQPARRLTITTLDLIEAVQDHVRRKIAGSPTIDGLLSVDLVDYRIIGSHDIVQQGSLTFILKPESTQ